MKLSIRRATPRDAALILKLIRGLAEYERLAHQMEATVGQIRRHGFGRFDLRLLRASFSCQE